MSQNNELKRPINKQTDILSAYSPRQRQAISFPENSPYTKQEFKDESDINKIMARYAYSGELPNIIERAPQYLDVTGIDFQNSMQFVAEAQTLFNELPSAIRNRFDNQPALFLDFCSNPANREEMAQMGLLKPKTEWIVPEPIPAPTPTPEPKPEG